MVTFSDRFREALNEWWEEQKKLPPPPGVRRRNDPRAIGTNELDRMIGAKNWSSRAVAGKRKERPDQRYVRRAAKVLGVRYEWLMFGDGAKRATDVDDETALQKELRLSLEGKKTDRFEMVANGLRGDGISDAAIAAARAKGIAIDASFGEIEDAIIACQQALTDGVATRAKERRAAKAAAPACGAGGSSAPPRRKLG